MFQNYFARLWDRIKIDETFKIAQYAQFLVLRNIVCFTNRIICLRSCFSYERLTNGVFVTVLDRIIGRIIFFIIWFVRLLALRPLLPYCASLG
jgi:hypothetical protein